MLTTRRTITLALATASLAVAPAAALAKDGDVVRRASCSSGAEAKLKLSPDDGRIETEFEVDANRNGVTWKVTIRRNGRLAVSRKATTRGPSGSFTVRRRLADGAGRDTVRARAVSPSGQVCRIRASI